MLDDINNLKESFKALEEANKSINLYKEIEQLRLEIDNIEELHKLCKDALTIFASSTSWDYENEKYIWDLYESPREIAEVALKSPKTVKKEKIEELLDKVLKLTEGDRWLIKDAIAYLDNEGSPF